MSDRDQIRDALHFISAANRETWVRTGMAVKSELGDAGFEVWDAWSQQADSYNAKDARDVWKSIRANGKVTAGTLFHEAKANGWRDDRTHRKPTPEEFEAGRGAAADRTAKEEVEERARHEAAAARATEILAAATGDPATHPYAIKTRVPFGPLVRRGLWPQRGWTDALLVPIYGDEEHVWSIEAINADGSKDSLKDAAKRGGFHPLGKIRGASRVLIAEGLVNAAVGWAVDGSPGAAAMGKSNLLHTALAVRKLAPEAEIIILADNDLNVPREAQDAARAVGGQVAMPDLGGRKCDFWDLWHERGGEAVRAAIADTRASDGTTAASEDEPLDTKAVVERLAKLSRIEYDRVREAEAERLGVRVSTLDAEVEKARRKLTGDGNDGQGEAVLFPDIEPWTEPVDGAELIADLVALFRRYLVLPEHAAVALALWTVFTHCIDAANIAPILAITSPVKRCGKSAVLIMLGRLVLRSLPSSNISAAALFRAVEAWAPTLLIDEGDTFIWNSDELRGVLNSGHTRELAFVIRTVGDDHQPRRFSTWGAKAIALIGKLPDTLADRSIEVALKRKLPGERVEKLRHADRERFHLLARRSVRFAGDHAEAIRAARPSMPEGLHDRAQDNWEPLLAIADLAGGPWPEQARAAALALSCGDEKTRGLGIELLGDIRGVFEKRSVDRLSSEDLVLALVGLEERPWVEYRGKPVTMAKLARLLRPFGVVSGTIRLPDGTAKGYLLDQFTDPFARYLPTKTSQRHNVGVARVSEDFESVTAGGCDVSENGPESSCGAGCDVVTDSITPSWQMRL
jgi:putative DNA primase/helicase